MLRACLVGPFLCFCRNLRFFLSRSSVLQPFLQSKDQGAKAVKAFGGSLVLVVINLFHSVIKSNQLICLRLYVGLRCKGSRNKS